jgi:hypothetical protein
MSITHKFISGKAAAADATVVDGPNWDDDHKFNVASEIVLGGRIGVTPNRYYVANCNGGTALGTVASVANSMWAVPFVPSEDCSIDTILIEVTTLLAGNARVGVYSDDGNLHPNALLGESTTGSVSNGTVGVKTFSFTTPVALKGGTTYWLALATSVAVTLRAVPVASAVNVLGFGATVGAVSGGFCWRSSFTFAALPSTFPTTSEAIIAATFPAIAARFV